MNFTGKLKEVQRDWKTGQYNITFTCNEASAMQYIDELKDVEKLNIKATKYRQKRSLDANAMLWACIGEIAAAENADKWQIYLDMLRQYGKYTHICVKPYVVEAVKAQWRECEVIGEIDINGEKAVQMLCYFGSSTYNTKEFSRLLEGVIFAMQQSGLQPPASKEMQLALERWEKQIEKKHNC